jgi:hypothetical protein
MGNIEYSYRVDEINEGLNVNYIFISNGPNGYKVKVVQYEFLKYIDGKPVFNLGFGDFDPESNNITDTTLTNYGDVYKIFNTVLNTILPFYEKYPNAFIFVEGSDNTEEFKVNCKANCVRDCIESCHFFNRTMRLYCKEVSRKFEFYASTHQFLGGMRNKIGWFDFEDFIRFKLYDSIMVFQKNL